MPYLAIIIFFLILEVAGLFIWHSSREKSAYTHINVFADSRVIYYDFNPEIDEKTRSFLNALIEKFKRDKRLNVHRSVDNADIYFTFFADTSICIYSMIELPVSVALYSGFKFQDIYHRFEDSILKSSPVPSLIILQAGLSEYVAHAIPLVAQTRPPLYELPHDEIIKLVESNILKRFGTWIVAPEHTIFDIVNNCGNVVKIIAPSIGKLKLSVCGNKAEYFWSWFKRFQYTKDWLVLYSWYLRGKTKGEIIPMEFYAGIEKWKNIIKKTSEKTPFDWCLISAIIWVESKFYEYAVSLKGAMGLMQIMPFNFKRTPDSIFNPEVNINAGISHLAYLYNFWKKRGFDDSASIFLSVASYNSGPAYLMPFADSLSTFPAEKPLSWDEILLIFQSCVFEKDTTIYTEWNKLETFTFLKNVRDAYLKCLTRYTRQRE